MELELLTAEEATCKPAGRAREEPNRNPTLPEPKCASPATVFLVCLFTRALLKHSCVQSAS